MGWIPAFAGMTVLVKIPCYTPTSQHVPAGLATEADLAAPSSTVVTLLQVKTGSQIMKVTTFSSREFNQAASQAKRAANDGPVFITDRGKPAHVLMSMALYQRLSGSQQKIADLLAMPRTEDIELEIPRWDELARPADLS
jgi:prevent-host-death family protein